MPAPSPTLQERPSPVGGCSIFGAGFLGAVGFLTGVPAMLLGLVCVWCAWNAYAVEIAPDSGGGSTSVNDTFAAIGYVILFAGALISGGLSLILGLVSSSAVGAAVVGGLVGLKLRGG